MTLPVILNNETAAAYVRRTFDGFHVIGCRPSIDAPADLAAIDVFVRATDGSWTGFASVWIVGGRLYGEL